MAPFMKSKKWKQNRTNRVGPNFDVNGNETRFGRPRIGIIDLECKGN